MPIFLAFLAGWLFVATIWAWRGGYRGLPLASGAMCVISLVLAVATYTNPA